MGELVIDRIPTAAMKRTLKEGEHEASSSVQAHLLRTESAAENPLQERF